MEMFHPEQDLDRHPAVARVEDLHGGSDFAYPVLDVRQGGGIDQVGLVEDDQIAACDLRPRQRGLLIRRAQRMLGVHHGQHAVDQHLVADLRLQEGLVHALRVGHAARLDHDVLGTIDSIGQFQDRLDQVHADAAADAAVGQGHHAVLHFA